MLALSAEEATVHHVDQMTAFGSSSCLTSLSSVAAVFGPASSSSPLWSSSPPSWSAESVLTSTSGAGSTLCSAEILLADPAVRARKPVEKRRAAFALQSDTFRVDVVASGRMADKVETTWSYVEVCLRVKCQ